MSGNSKNKFAAGAQALGYIYQLRYGLYKLLGLPETEGVFIERDDDVESIDAHGAQELASLKHKAGGDKVNDLSVDFWKSVRIWLERYNDDGKMASNLRFFLVTTAKVSANSFIASLLPDAKWDDSVTDKAHHASYFLQQSRNRFHYYSPRVQILTAICANASCNRPKHR